MITERPLQTPLGGIDVTLEHDLRLGRHLEIDGLAGDHGHPGAAQPAREHHLVDAGRQGRRAGVDRDRIAAEGDGDLHRLALLLRDPLVLGRALVRLPVHPEGPLVVDLQAVHADVARARDRIAREHEG